MNQLKGIVTSIKNSPNIIDNMYNIICESNLKISVVTITSDIILNLFDIVEGKLIASRGKSADKFKITILGTTNKKEYQRLISTLYKKYEPKNYKISDFPKGLVSMLNNNLSSINEMAEIIIKCILSGAPMSIHFHGDGDGSSGSIALYDSIKSITTTLGVNNKNIYWSATRGISYSEEFSYLDEMIFSSYESIEKPITMIIDFGTTSESNIAIERISKVSTVLWIDHHIINNNFHVDEIEYYINPWKTGGNSNLTAGFLTCVLAEMISNSDFSLMMKASLISDHSEFASDDSESEDMATFLDAINIHNDFYKTLNPQYMESVISDREKYTYIINEYNEQMGNAILIGLNKCKKYKSSDGFSVYLLDFTKIAKMNMKYVKQGKYTSEFQTMLERKESGIASVVYYKKYISMRASQSISKKVGFLSIINKMEEETDYIENGGGHNEAASIKIKGQDMNAAVTKLIHYFGVPHSL